jgi:hypothetical protein
MLFGLVCPSLKGARRCSRIAQLAETTRYLQLGCCTASWSRPGKSGTIDFDVMTPFSDDEPVFQELVLDDNRQKFGDI